MKSIMEKMFKNSFVVCILILGAIFVTTIVFAADVTVKAGNVNSKAIVCRLYRSGDVATSGTNYEKINLNAESYDTDSIGDPTTNYRITPTKAGYYQVNAKLTWQQQVRRPEYGAKHRYRGPESC